MWSLVERAKKVIIALVLSVIPLVLLYVQSKDTQIRSVLAWPIIELAGILESSALKITGAVSDSLYKYFFIANRTQELLELRAEVLETRALKVQILDLIHERAAILELNFKSPDSTQEHKREYARVVARAGAPMARMIRLDKGSRHGVRVKCPVLANEGVVGQVLSVAPNFSDVLLITDASSALEAKIVSSAARGILRGKSSANEYLMEIRDVDGMSDVRTGDAVVTSGVNSYFPSGIPIGRILEASKSSDGLNISARIEPFVAMDRVSQVVVLLGDWSLAGGIESFSASWPLAAQ
jgi:rod shape-determining protein MreC